MTHTATAQAREFLTRLRRLIDALEPGDDGRRPIFRDRTYYAVQGMAAELTAGPDAGAAQQPAAHVNALIELWSPDDLRQSRYLRSEIAAGLKEAESRLSHALWKRYHQPSAN